MRVAHVITRMIIGGAQENTLFNCLDLIDEFGDGVLLISGPSTGPEGKLLDAGRSRDLPIKIIPDLQRSIHPVRDRGAYASLRDALRAYQPTVVHTHSAKGGFLGRAAAWKLNVPVVVHTVHGAPFHPYQNVISRRLFIHLERWAARRCHHLISVADAMTDLMVDARVAPREKFTTIYSGMDVSPFQNCWQLRSEARAELGLQDEDIVFGKIARMFHLKGHEYLVESAKDVVSKIPNCRFLLVGDGILRSQLEQRIAELGLTKNFKFTGLVPPERVPYYLSAMDALIHTSLREGLARTLPQALIAEKPVISYDVDGAREVVITGQTGILLPPKSIEALSEGILQLAEHPDERRRMGQEGAKRFTEVFRHEFMTQRIRDLYLRLGADPTIL